LYSVGIEIKNSSGKTYHQQTDRTVKVGMPEYAVMKKDPGLPATGKIMFGIDQQDDDGSFLTISGWAAFENRDATNSNIIIAFKNESGIYSAETEPVKRPDVTSKPGNSFNLDHSGFRIKIQKNSIPKGNYQLLLIIKNTKYGDAASVITDRMVSIQ